MKVERVRILNPTFQSAIRRIYLTPSDLHSKLAQFDSDVLLKKVADSEKVAEKLRLELLTNLSKRCGEIGTHLLSGKLLKM